jgi:hypothetical protein
MSTQYPGGFITKSPVAPTSSAASGIWTVDQALQYVKAGTWPSPSNYIEDVFSTYLYTGNGSTQTITNNIDLSTKGGLVWIKDRDSGAKGHALFDTARGVNLKLQSQSTNGQFSGANQLTAFNTTGFALGSDTDPNGSGTTYVSWTFREQAKFFDVVTYTGNGTAGRTVSHNLGSVPGCIIVKCTSTGGTSWNVYHRSLGSGSPQDYVVQLDTTAAQVNSSTWNYTAPTSTVFTLDSGGNVNANGATYVAYLFAHNAGGFGSTGSDNVISCDLITTDGTGNATVNLGYEPQWIMFKRSDGLGSWYMVDNMRGWPANTSLSDAVLFANGSNSESASNICWITSTGFTFTESALRNFIYIAIRRGPMKVPTVGTSVFSPITRTGTGVAATVTGVGFPFDLSIIGNRVFAGAVSAQGFVFDRLRSPTQYLFTSDTAAEGVNGIANSLLQDGYTITTDVPSGAYNFNTWTYIDWFFRRAPSFFDEVCYTGTGSATTVTHNLAAVPELMIVRRRDGGGGQWMVYNAAGGNTNRLNLNATGAYNADISYWNNTSPTSSVFTVGSGADVNASGLLFVAYLFATCAGVSKVGSYTGTAALQTVACGFTSGARFVLIKRTDSTGDWYVWDSARGISSSTDPYLLLNSTAAEVTVTNYVDTDTTGFKVTAAASTTVNISAASYIFLAIA